jgi:hypothetical protein
MSSGLEENLKISWKRFIKEDLRIMKINNWTKCMQDRVKWKKVVETAKTFKQRSCSG